MPNKPTLPRSAKRIPKGRTKADYEPEVIRAYDLNLHRIRQERYRKRKRHAGHKDVTVLLAHTTRQLLTELAKLAGMSKTRYITHLIHTAAEEATHGRPTNEPAEAGG